MIKESLADSFPELVISWHPHKNGGLTPYKVAPKSNQKVWWLCEQKHEWQAAIASRTGQNKTGCPVCSGRKPTDNNNLAVLFPHLLEEWDYVKNGTNRPHDFLPNSHKIIWWKCKKGHEWQTRIVYRSRQASGCPYCSGRLVGTDNSFGLLYPTLANEWHPVKNGELTPNDVRPGTDRKVWWLCDKGHSYEAAICHRTNNNKATGCPYCSGRKASKENNLKYLFPKIAIEWNNDKNNPLRPEMVTPGSNRRVWWKCINGHEWITSPNHRTRLGTNCPNCAPQTSKLEIRLFCELKYLFKDNVNWRFKINGIEIDLFLPKYSVGIEIDGYPWHLNKEKKDIAKSIELRQHGIKLLRLRDNKLPFIDETDLFYESLEEDLGIIKRLLLFLNQYVDFDNIDKELIKEYLALNKLQSEEEYNKVLSYLPSPPPEYSLANIHNHLVTEWNYERNNPLRPENFLPSARANVWWKCPEGHEYQSYIYNRIKGVGCPYCAGKRLSKDNTLESKFPNLVEEWDYNKNFPLTPSDVYYGSNLKVWWMCKKGHSWRIKITNRTKRSSGCPYCSNKRIDNNNSLKAIP